jgi:site-specific DNA-methyltransferase (adenine-specific)
LDPFLGSGTTSLAANNLNRNSIGYEINKDFLTVIKDKIGFNKLKLFTDLNIDITNQELPETDWTKEIKKLPYVFHDPVNFNKKIDPRKLMFGSKIDKTFSEKINYFSIKSIITSEIIVLKNNIKIRLIGVKENPKNKSKAIDFLKKKTKGQKLILKYDEVKYDSNNNLMCYLYLKNKTFINAHLIKQGLVDVDLSMEYRHKSKFLSFARRK